MTNAKIDLMAPEWQMEDAYGARPAMKRASPKLSKR